MNATIYGYIKGQKAVAAVNIVSGNFKHQRIIPLKQCTANQAELFALGYVMSAVKDESKKVQLTVTTTNPYVNQVMKRDPKTGGWMAKPEKNIELVQEVRSKVEKWALVTLDDKKSEALDKLKVEAKAAING